MRRHSSGGNIADSGLQVLWNSPLCHTVHAAGRTQWNFEHRDLLGKWYERSFSLSSLCPLLFLHIHTLGEKERDHDFIYFVSLIAVVLLFIRISLDEIRRRLWIRPELLFLNCHGHVLTVERVLESIR